MDHEDEVIEEAREQGKRLLSRWSRRVIDRFAGPDPESKRALSGFLAGLGALGAGLGFVDGTPGWIGPTGLFLIILAWALTNAASGQQRVEIRARDRIEWGREAQRLRRSLGAIWRRLEGQPFRIYTEAHGQSMTLSQAVSKAGWPDARTDWTEGLEGFMRECLPPPDHHSIIHERQRETFRHAALGRDRELITDWETAKDILEIWSIALDVGGSRAPALREVIRRLKANHLDSIRLIWFLSIAHTEHNPFAGNPNYSFVARIRNVMEGRE